MTISIEISGHFGFLHVMHHLVEVTLESLFQAVFGLAYILFLASSAGDAVDEVVAVARHRVESPQVSPVCQGAPTISIPYLIRPKLLVSLLQYCSISCQQCTLPLKTKQTLLTFHIHTEMFM